jgi:hypothetical protein
VVTIDRRGLDVAVTGLEPTIVGSMRKRGAAGSLPGAKRVVSEQQRLAAAVVQPLQISACRSIAPQNLVLPSLGDRLGLRADQPRIPPLADLDTQAT